MKINDLDMGIPVYTHFALLLRIQDVSDKNASLVRISSNPAMQGVGILLGIPGSPALGTR